MDNLLRVIGTLDMASPSGISWTTNTYFSKYRPTICLNKINYGDHKDDLRYSIEKTDLMVVKPHGISRIGNSILSYQIFCYEDDLKTARENIVSMLRSQVLISMSYIEKNYQSFFRIDGIDESEFLCKIRLSYFLKFNGEYNKKASMKQKAYDRQGMYLGYIIGYSDEDVILLNNGREDVENINDCYIETMCLPILSIK